MLISAREAAGHFREVGLTRERARLLLATGIAGGPVRTAGALLYDEDRVRHLANRPPITPEEVTEACPHGVFVARLAPARRVDLTLDPSGRREPVTGPWTLSLAMWATIRVAATRGVSVPLLATVSGFVVEAAVINDVRDEGAAGHRLLLDDPGGWCNSLVGRRWLPGRGGPPLVAWGWTARLATG